MPQPVPVVTFDLFSALLDSRRGGTQAFAALGRGRGWSVEPARLYDRWDGLNKASQRDCAGWASFRELARRALADTYAELGLTGDVGADGDALIASMAHWPMWPDVAAALPGWAADGGLAGHRIGVLSNVDDDILAGTEVAPFVAPALALTSERLRAYKPHAAIYTAARDHVGGGMVHVATSARDVRGALEAGCPMLRLRRPGHAIDPDGPRPPYEVDDVRDLPGVLTQHGPTPSR